MTERYLGVAGIGEALGVSRHAVHKWRSRYPGDSEHPFPDPDVEVDGTPGWRPDRLTEIIEWRNGLPGRGVGGGRPTAARQEYLKEAAARGLGRDEALRALVTLSEEFPEMTEPEICAWLIGHWRR
ncbi:hypothetical protein [Microbispora rosea]|uniref:hypothetical protein n=1 Tax=Microbispora rosea TaxID=58117 RepID=UPI00343F68C9